MKLGKLKGKVQLMMAKPKVQSPDSIKFTNREGKKYILKRKEYKTGPVRSRKLA